MMSNGDPVRSKTVDVTVCRLRQKLEPHGIEVLTIWGTGFMLSKAGRDRANKILTDAAPPPSTADTTA